MEASTKLVISTSMMLDFLSCPQMWYNRHILGRVPKSDASALRIGKAWHEAMEAWWAGKTHEDTVSVFDKIEDPYERVKLQAMLAGYTARWGHTRSDFKVIGIEEGFVVPIVNPDTGEEHPYCDLGLVVDKIVENKQGVFFVEHKTTSDDTERSGDYWKRLAIDMQVSNYYLGAAKKYDISGCLYDVVGKPALRPLKATPEDKRKYKKDGTPYANQREKDETPGEYGLRLVSDITDNANSYYQRGSVSRTDKQLGHAKQDLWWVANMIFAAYDSGESPRNTRACRKIGGSLCEYFDVCAGTASITDSERYKDSEYKPGGKKLPMADSKYDPAVGF